MSGLSTAAEMFNEMEAETNAATTSENSQQEFEESGSLWDQLESSMDAEEAEPSKEESEEPSEKVEEKEESEEPKEEVKEEEPKEEEPKEEEKRDEEKQDEESSEDSADDSKDDDKIKKIEGSFKDESVSIAADTVFKHKVDGKEVEVSFQELLNNFSGKQSWDKKFQELSAEKNELKGEKEAIEAYVDNFAEKVQNKDYLGALEYLAEFSGMSSLDFRRGLRESMMPQFEEFSKMDESQKEAALLKEENEYLKQVKESEETKAANQQTHEELRNRILEIQEAHKVDDETLKSAYQELVDGYEGEVTAEILNEYLGIYNSFSKAESILTGVDAELVKDGQLVGNLANLIRENKDYTDDDWTDVVKQSLESQKKEEPSQEASKKVSERVRETNQEPKVKQEKATLKNVTEQILTFDDLEDY